MTRAERVVSFEWRPAATSGGRYFCASLLLLLVWLFNACSSKLVIATWACSQSSDAGRTDSMTSEAGDSLEFPWSTSFENGFCDYSAGGGFCFAAGVSRFQIVTSPVIRGSMPQPSA